MAEDEPAPAVEISDGLLAEPSNAFLSADEDLTSKSHSKEELETHENYLSLPAIQRQLNPTKWTEQDRKRLKTPFTIIASLILVWAIALLAPQRIEPHLEKYQKDIQEKVHAKVQAKLSEVPSVKVNFRPPPPQFNQSKVALLVEQRPLGTLVPLINHMSHVIPPDWEILFLGSAGSVKHVNSSSVLQRSLKSSKLRVRRAPVNLKADARENINQMFTNLTFYDNFLPKAEWLLVFHSDSILCSMSPTDLNDWLEYDWVGAPWRHEDKHGGSGGLSLRRISKIREVLSFQARQDTVDAEDKWMSDRIGLLPSANVANVTVEQKFSVEGIWAEKPMGYHLKRSGGLLPGGVWESPEQRKKIYEYCPEIKMIMDMKLERERC